MVQANYHTSKLLRSVYFVSIMFCALLGLFVSNSTLASFADDSVSQLKHEWAIIKYQTPRNQQLSKFEALIYKAEQLERAIPNDPRIQTWHGTILSTYASIKGGLGALPYVKQARSLLEKAVQRNPQVEDGLAHAVLGALYARVPGWPIGFGDKKKARAHLEMALKINPRSIDANYYYGDFLVDIGEYQKGKQYLDIANRTIPRRGYETQDRGRKREVAESLAKIRRYTR